MDISMQGKRGFAPAVQRRRGRETYLVLRVVYGELGGRPLRKRYPSFADAEAAAAVMNKRRGLSEDEAWLLVENTVMASR